MRNTKLSRPKKYPTLSSAIPSWLNSTDIKLSKKTTLKPAKKQASSAKRELLFERIVHHVILTSYE